MVKFHLDRHEGYIEVFTTRVDTIFGVTFMVIAPELELVDQITTPEYAEAVAAYKKYSSSKSDVDRQQEKVVSGQFTGAHVLHPFTGEKIPVFIADYVLAGYGTGAVMAVPSGDQRDYLFAKKYDLPIIPILDAQQNLEEASDPTKEGRYINSGFINGMSYREALEVLFVALEEKGSGSRKINFRMRDAGYSRQRYWGEPFPVYYDNDGIVRVLTEDQLPLTLPDIAEYKPTADGRSPLANAQDWVTELGDGKVRETDTMPAYAGSSWYFLRYMDPKNEKEFVGQDAQTYWQDVDLYIGGTEHAVGHLLYSRFWHKFFKDNGWVSTEEPFRKLVNQGMIQGRSLLTIEGTIRNLPGGVHVPVQYASAGDKLFREQFEELAKADNRFAHIHPDTDVHWQESEGRQFIPLQYEVEKMSKSKYNVVNPDDMIGQYGADVFRMFEMFLGPIEAHKPWDTNGIEGVNKFIRKLWRLYGFNEDGQPTVYMGSERKVEKQILHKAIKKVTEDIERFSFNTAVSALMIAVNDFQKLVPLSKFTLETLPLLLSPLAPFTAEALWGRMGKSASVIRAAFPLADEKYLIQDTVLYPVSINGKVRAKLVMDAGLNPEEIEEIVLKDEQVMKYIGSQTPKKVIVVPGRIVNIVL
jgi:leucyl-tRNA synthetase